MDLSNGGSGSGEEEIDNSQKGKKNYHRHSTQQIQQLEAFYSECPHPDKNQRQQLSRELGLDPKQIKFWFQNKRTQIKAQNEKADNNALRTENERIHFENLAMQDALNNIFCPACNGSSHGEEERRLNLMKLKMENARLKEEHERAINFFANHVGNLVTPLPGMDPPTNMPGNTFLLEGMEPTTNNPVHMLRYSDNAITSGIMDIDRSLVIEAAVGAMNELVDLLRVNEPVWIKAPTDERYMLHRDSYDKLFPLSNHIKTSSARFESSKDSGEVAMAGMHLIEMLLDVNKWKEMFPTIVTKANTIDVIDTGIVGGLLHLMHEKVHVLSPLVAPREFFFIRYCRQLNQSTWVMVDVSYDFIKVLQDVAPTRSWKLPSGCMIEDMSNGKSTVTWIEHVQVDDKPLTHRLYRDLVCGCQAYGAKRWITTLQRMCERFAFSMGLINTPNPKLDGVLLTPEAQINLMKLSNRMVKNFCEALSMSDKLDFPQLSEYENSGVRVSFRKNNDPGQLEGFIVTAATSIWLPLSKEQLFDFLKDEKTRVQWDVLASGNPVPAVARVLTGTHPGNSISILQPFAPKERKMMILQESIIDPLGGLLIYAPMDLSDVLSVANLKDTTRTQILPSGYVISSDGRANKATGASTSSNTGNSIGSLLTVAFQILVSRTALTKETNMESVANVHALISTTVQNIKRGLNYSD